MGGYLMIGVGVFLSFQSSQNGQSGQAWAKDEVKGKDAASQVAAIQPHSTANLSSSTIILEPESKLQLFGDSTLHKFSSNATQIHVDGKIERDSSVPAGGLNLKVGSFSFSIPVDGLKSGDKKLDQHLYEALKVKNFADIQGVIKTFEVKGRNADASHSVSALFDLTVAGFTKTVPVDGTLTLEGDRIRVKGEKQLLMTDFKVDPPSLMLGVIKTANEITIRFDLSLVLKQPTGKE